MRALTRTRVVPEGGFTRCVRVECDWVNLVPWFANRRKDGCSFRTPDGGTFDLRVHSN